MLGAAAWRRLGGGLAWRRLGLAASWLGGGLAAGGDVRALVCACARVRVRTLDVGPVEVVFDEDLFEHVPGLYVVDDVLWEL